MWLPDPFQQDQERSYVATWPPGYPLAISVLSKLFSIDVFTASKLVSLMCFVASAALVFRFFGHDSAPIALLLVNASTLTIFSFSWSEAPFILALLVFSIAITQSLENPTPSWRHHFFVPLGIAIILFEIRYVGAFAIGVLLVTAAISLRRSLKSCFLLVFAAISTRGVCLSQIKFNIAQTGHATGPDRIPAPESNAELAWTLITSLRDKLLLPLSTGYYGRLFWIGVGLQCALFLWVIAVYVRLPKEVRGELKPKQANGFLLVGLGYLAAIIFLRWRTHFDPFSYRLLNPGILLIFIFFVNFMLKSKPGIYNHLFASLFILGIFSGGWIARETLWLRSGPDYFAQSKARLERYSDIPSGTIIAFGDRHMRYLRPDIFITEPQFTPYYKTSETWDEFAQRLTPHVPIVIDAVETHPWRGYDPRILEFLNAQEQGALIWVDEKIEAELR